VIIAGALEPSGVPIEEAATSKGDGARSFRSDRDSRSRGWGKRKKSRPRPYERRMHTR
jgi:hypothetical protein